ncbi:hypothetical protein AMTRI_Chr01g103440 [Amborella trichopoda]
MAAMEDHWVTGDPPPHYLPSDFEALQIPPLDPAYTDGLFNDMDFPQTLMDGIEFSDDDLNFDLDDILLPSSPGSGNNSGVLPDSGQNCGSLMNSGDSGYLSNGDSSINIEVQGSQIPASLSSDHTNGDPEVDSSGSVLASCDPSIQSVTNSETATFFPEIRVCTDNKNQLLIDSGNTSSMTGFCGTRDPGVLGSESPQSLQCSQVSADYKDRPSPDSGHGSSSMNFGDTFTSGLSKSEPLVSFQGKRKKAREDGSPSSNNEEEEKKKARLMRNRESAQLSRQRKKHYVDELEDKVRAMHSTIAELNSRLSFATAENMNLRHQLIALSPTSNAYAQPSSLPSHFPWVPCSSYAMNPQNGLGFPPGSQVPLLPIPRLRTQQTVSSSKGRKSSKVNGKDGDGSKPSKRIKKVASVSFLGFFLFLLFFGGLIPVLDFRHGKISDQGVPPKGRVLIIRDHVNTSDRREVIDLVNGDFGKENWDYAKHKRDGYRDSGTEAKQKERGSHSLPFSDTKGSVRPDNASEPMVASLYVPRNDKLVKIDGNLILHAVLASEKAVASSAGRESEKQTMAPDGEALRNGLTITSAMTPAIPAASNAALYRETLRRRARSSTSRNAYLENQKASSIDGPLQEWFLEGLTGPTLSSGMCTEVFQFEVNTTIIPKTPSSKARNSSENSLSKNRRFLYHDAIPLPGKTVLNETGESWGKREKGEERKIKPGMVVSVLVDPREANDDSVGPPSKRLGRVFVVVLIDSIKYVTYSCVVPGPKGSKPHLVTR